MLLVEADSRILVTRTEERRSWGNDGERIQFLVAQEVYCTK
jgi:hypothetical protein